MSTAIAVNAAGIDQETMLILIAGGDCSRLNAAQKIAYYNARCEAAGLDPRAQPFSFIKLQGKEVLYALKAATDQLASKHGIVCQIVSQATDEGIRVVTVRAAAKDGRATDEIGAVAVKGLTGDALCNAMMKAVTKAKRRAVLSLAGLGLMDETEVETIPGAAPVETPAPEVQTPPAKVFMSVVNAARAKHIWEEAQDIGITKETFPGWVEKVLGSPKRSTEWTSEDMDKLEAETKSPRDIDY
jgi:hypothetical protein